MSHYARSVPNSHVLGVLHEVLHDFLHDPSSQFTRVRNPASSQDWWMPVTCACFFHPRSASSRDWWMPVTCARFNPSPVPNSHVLGIQQFPQVLTIGGCLSLAHALGFHSASSQDRWMPVTCACVRISVRSQICGRLSLASRGITRACFISSCKVPVRGCSFTCVEMNHSCMFQFFPPCLNAQLP